MAAGLEHARPRSLAPSTVTVHGPDPEHAPVQPMKIDPGAAVAVSVTDVPAAIGIEQLSRTRRRPRPSGTVTCPAPVRLIGQHVGGRVWQRGARDSTVVPRRMTRVTS